MQSWHFEGKAAEEMFRQEQREQEDREKKRAEKDKPFGLLAKMKATGWEPGQQLPAVDGIESDHTIDFTIIPIAKPLEWLFKPLVGLVRASWLGNAAARAASKIEGNVSKHTFPYAERVRRRALEDPVSHNFPYSFDDIILSTIPILKITDTRYFKSKGQ